MTSEHVDVVVVGAGLSGIGAGYHLQTMCPDRSYVILEGRENLGGTWDLFKYPGVRSDSDMHTLGFSFKPWTEAKSIADGPSILKYLKQTVSQFGIDQHIRYGQLVTKAQWSTDDAQWTVTSTNKASGTINTFTCSFLFMCSGYYSYKKGHTPEFTGRERFKGTIVHPQEWPTDLDYTGKRVVVIGSGATAVTIVPSMADKAAHVTMLQRSPTYMVSRPDHDVLANRMRKVLPPKVAYNLTRFKNTWRQQLVYNKTRTDPNKVKQLLLGGIQLELGADYDIAKHFTPNYNPWDQRLCLVPNGDFFKAMREGKASVVTDHISSFTETGIQLASGEHLEADIIVTATGLELVTLGEMDFFVDGNQVDFAKTWTYKGFAYSDIPNMASTFGYINASWTLRSDLTAEYVCRLLNHMRKKGVVQCTPRLREQDRNMKERPWIDGFSSGYMQRMMHRMPRQGDHEPWINPQNYRRDKKMFKHSPIDDGVMQFSKQSARV
ncbi:cyclohexanone monooxygenase [Actinomycetes bacterium]|nr:cyclohexanone monooxygenase [Actinomycetes bacterium]